MMLLSQEKISWYNEQNAWYQKNFWRPGLLLCPGRGLKRIMASRLQAYPPALPVSVHERLDDLMQDTGVFTLKKHDTSTTAGIMDGRVFGLSEPVWVKRFNYRGPLKFTVKKIFGSRARRLFTVSRLLSEKGLPVPQPLYYIEPSFKEKNAFYVCSVIGDAENLYELFTQGVLQGNRELLFALAHTMASWHLAGAVHGDMKWPNILVRKGKEGYTFFFVDLDQAKLYHSPFVKGIEKDLKRFFRFGIEVSSEGLVENDFFPEYIKKLPGLLQQKIDLRRVREQAYRIWQQKGQKRI